MNVKCIYTVITGNYDSLKEPAFVTEGWDYICFTDDPSLHSDIWDIRLIDSDPEISEVKNARKVKILGYEYLDPHYELAIFIAGKIRVNCDLEVFLKDVAHYNDDVNLILPDHPWRSCVFGEFKSCLRHEMITEELADLMIKKYKAEGYPINNGLHACTMLIMRLQDKGLRSFMRRWWEVVHHYSHRDQLSFDYTLWKHDGLLTISSFSHEYVTGKRDNYFIQYAHGHSQKEVRC